jgi:hypothetical protein
LIEETLAALGFASPFDTTTVIPNLMTVFDAKLKGTQMFREYITTARLFRQASCGVRDGWDLRKVSKSVKMILNAVGLDIVSETKRVQVKGKRTQEERNYRLCPESVSRMLELVKLRLLRTDLTPRNEHAAAALSGHELSMYSHLVDVASPVEYSFESDGDEPSGV